MAYNHTYLGFGGKVDQVVVTDVNDANCNFLSRTTTNRDLDSVEIDTAEGTQLTTRSKDICLVDNPTASQPTCIKWVVDATDQANGYVELPASTYLYATDAEMDCYATVHVAGRMYDIDITAPAAHPRDFYRTDRTSGSEDRLTFKMGVLRVGMNVKLILNPK